MFSKRIIGSARFLRMPGSTQALYFHLGMAADDDGIVEAYPIMQMVNASEDDLRLLAAKGFVKVLNGRRTTRYGQTAKSTAFTRLYFCRSCQKPHYWSRVRGLTECVLTLQRTTTGQRMDNPWTTRCQPRDNHGTRMGRPLDDQRTTVGHKWDGIG